jgi:beta-glucanase (GH16 family)
MKLSSIAICLVFVVGCSSTTNDGATVIPKVIVNDFSQVEGDGGITSIEFPVRLEQAISEELVLAYRTDDASAFQNMDYRKAEGQIVIQAGSTEAVIPLEIVADDIKEGDELFRLLFEPLETIDFTKTIVFITIRNDDTSLPYDEEDYSTPKDYEGWKPAWVDEFDQPDINEEWWTHEIGRGNNGWGNNELQYYTDASENSRIENGNLVIEARDDSWNGKKYTSARIITMGKQSFSYGRIDIRARLPYGQGIWPALWMLGDSFEGKGWPSCGEIDIMELVGHQPATSHATVHWGSDGSHYYTGDSYKLSTEVFNDRYHVFSVVRELGRMWFYVDDVIIFEFGNEDLQGQQNPFNDPFFFIFNIAVGGNWPGSPDGSTSFPQTMEVDYVRVFEKD